MANTAQKIEEIRQDLNESDYNEEEKRVLTEAVDIMNDMHNTLDLLDFPTQQMLVLLDDFGGTENPLLTFIAFIFNHLDDYFTDGVLGDYFEFDD